MRFFIVFFAIFPLLLNAQITITDAEMPQNSEIHFYAANGDFSSVDVNLTGTNYSWDYSGITGGTQDTTEIATVASTPLAYQVNFNNPFQPDYFADYAIKGQDLDVMGQVSVTNRFDFYKVNSSSLQVVGFGANVNGVPMSVKYDTIDQIYPLSMTYGTSDSTSAYYLVSIPSLGTYGQWINRKVEVDGWGDITTPFDSYANTLRVKTTLYQKDTVYVDQFGFGTIIDRPIEEIYEWYETAQGVPVFKAVVRGGVLTEVKFKNEQFTTIEESLSQLKIYPNPVRDVLHLELNNPYSFELINLEGKIVKSEKQTLSRTLDFSTLDAGFYTFKISSEGVNQTFKLVKE